MTSRSNETTTKPLPARLGPWIIAASSGLLLLLVGEQLFDDGPSRDTEQTQENQSTKTQLPEQGSAGDEQRAVEHVKATLSPETRRQVTRPTPGVSPREASEEEERTLGKLHDRLFAESLLLENGRQAREGLRRMLEDVPAEQHEALEARELALSQKVERREQRIVRLRRDIARLEASYEAQKEVP